MYYYYYYLLHSFFNYISTYYVFIYLFIYLFIEPFIFKLHIIIVIIIIKYNFLLKFYKLNKYIHTCLYHFFSNNISNSEIIIIICWPYHVNNYWHWLEF